MTATRERRKERWRECAELIAQAGSIPDARRLAKRRKLRAANYNTSVWISALGKMLEASIAQTRKRRKSNDA